MNVAHTIMEQIKVTDRSALMAWGANTFVGGKIDGVKDGLKFKVQNCPKAKRGTWVMVLLDEETDTYIVRKFRILKGEVKYDEICEDVYCDTLVAVIDGMVG